MLKKYIDEDKLNMLPHFFKEDKMIKNIKESRRVVRFEFPKIDSKGSMEEKTEFV